MRQGNSSETLLEPATLYIAFDDEQTGVEVADHRDTTRRGHLARGAAPCLRQSGCGVDDIEECFGSSDGVV